MLLCKAYPVSEEKVGKCVDFERYFDFYVVFEMFRGERIRHTSQKQLLGAVEMRSDLKPLIIQYGIQSNSPKICFFLN